MATFRILDQAPQYLLPDGSLNAGGSLWFYETDLTTEKDTWADPNKSTLNANPVVLTSEGRTSTDVWGDGEYGVVMKDADGETITTRNNVAIPGGDETTIPALVAGQFLSNDGSNLAWQPVLQVPDPTGLANYVLASDGTGVPVWQQQTEPPTPPEPDIVVDDLAKSFLAGVSDDTTKFFIQAGTGSAPATGAKGTSTNIEYPEEFATVWFVAVTTTISAATPSGALVDNSVTGSTTTGFTANFNVSDDDNNSSWKISNTINFMWFAIGTKVVEAE